METNNELEKQGYNYYVANPLEYKNIRKELNAPAILFFGLLGLFAIAITLILLFHDEIEILFNN